MIQISYSSKTMLCPSHSYRLVFKSLRGQLAGTFRKETIHLQHLNSPTKTFTSLQRAAEKELDGLRVSQSESLEISSFRLLHCDWSLFSLEAPAPVQRLVGFPGSVEVIWIRLTLWLSVVAPLVQIEWNIRRRDTQWSPTPHGHIAERRVCVLHTAQLYPGVRARKLQIVWIVSFLFFCNCVRNCIWTLRWAAARKR